MRERLKQKLSQASFGLEEPRERAPRWLIFGGVGLALALAATVPLFVLPSAPFFDRLPRGTRASLRAALGAPTNLTLTSRPSGAKVLLEGELIGVTPLTVVVPWAEGEPLPLSVQPAVGASVTLNVVGGATLKKELELGPPPEPAPEPPPKEPVAPTPEKRPKKG